MRKIVVVQPKGYCAGVVRAINIAKIAKRENPDKPVYVLGQLVHNSIVLNMLKQSGINTLYIEGKPLIETIKFVPRDGVIVLGAHGHSKEIDKYIKKHKIKCYDATCPKVNNNFALIEKELAEGHQVIFIGINHHPESTAAKSISKDVFLYDVNQPFNYHLITDDAPFVVNQTTLNIVNLKEIHQDILRQIPMARIQDEICNATRIRQEGIINLPTDIDAIIVVGDYTSSNTNRLFEIAKSSHPNALVLLIQKQSELDWDALLNKQHIALVSGASTPPEVVDEIYSALLNF